MRNVQKALLYALLTPHESFGQLQDQGRFTKLLVLTEAMKTMPFEDVWNEYCSRQNVPDDWTWYDAVETYEQDVLSKR